MDARLILVFVFIQGITGGHSWSFDGKIGPGPTEWASRGYPLCAGNAQSPIDVPLDTVYDESLTDFDFHGYDTLGIDDLQIENQGPNLRVAIKQNSVGKAYFIGGGFQDKYAAVKMSFHWGINDTDFGFHTVHGQHYPLEMHILHKKLINNIIVDPPVANNDWAPIAFLYTLSENDNEVLAPFLDALDNAAYKGDKASFGTDFAHFMLKTTEYYRYHGSKGGPPCMEVCAWTVFKTTSTVSSAQLAKLRQVYRTERNAAEPLHMTFNHRPLQQLGDRKVKRNFHTDSVSTITASFGVVLCAVLILEVL